MNNLVHDRLTDQTGEERAGRLVLADRLEVVCEVEEQLGRCLRRARAVRRVEVVAHLGGGREERKMRLTRPSIHCKKCRARRRAGHLLRLPRKLVQHAGRVPQREVVRVRCRRSLELLDLLEQLRGYLPSLHL